MNPTRINQMNMVVLDRGALNSYGLKFGYPLDTHRLWESAAFGYFVHVHTYVPLELHLISM